MYATLTRPATDWLSPALRTAHFCVRSADELRRALREARDRPVALDATALDRVLRSDDEVRRLEVQGATRWASLAAWLGAAGEPLARWAAAERVPGTVGRSVSLDIPAPDGQPLAAHVEAIALVTLDGELRRIDRQHDARLFRLVLGGQGVFGLLYSVTLRLDTLLEAAAQADPALELDLPQAAAIAEPAFGVELLLPPETLPEFLDTARATALERRLTPRRIRVRRLRRGAETALAWARRDWAGVRLELQPRRTIGASIHAAELRRLLFGLALAHGGSFPASAGDGASRQQLEAAYPELADFLAAKRRYDPAERLQNDWYRGVTALLRETHRAQGHGR